MSTAPKSDFLGFELVTGHPPAEGSECTIQTLYEGDPKCTCCKSWVKEYPEDVRAQIEAQPETKQKALIVRMRKNHAGGSRDATDSTDGKPLVLDSVVVQSESLKRTLGEVFDGYKGITASLKRLVFKSPFHPFHYRWGRFTEILERQKVEDPVAASYSQILYDLLHSELNYVMSQVQDLTNHRVITYQLLWALFEPGQRVISLKDGQHQVFVVESVEYSFQTKEPHLGVIVKSIDWNGEQLGYFTESIKIGKFQGTRNIAELQACPVSYHPSKEEIMARAIARGRKFRDLCGIHYKGYTGSIHYRNGKKNVTRKVDGRMMVDAASYICETSNNKLPLTALDLGSMPELHVADDGHVDKAKQTSEDPNQLLEPYTIGQLEDKNGDNLTDQELMLCSAFVRGYSLRLTRWALFDVDNIKEIAWNKSAFSKLMLPDGYKELILSFVEEHSLDQAVFDDFIEGKGLGTILLLAGNPGTGKTLTAEAVADYVRRPLYVLNVGELGQSAKTVESRLQTVFELTEKWNSILLFDECDVFMQKRAVNTMNHNEVVAVALRILEYYRGILFMTSNRSEMIDRAFQSRIHLTLHYPDLTPESKEHIWRQLSSRSSAALTDDDFGRLRDLALNGRQIKNAIKNATMLANREKAALGVGHVKTVLAATQAVDVSQL